MVVKRMKHGALMDNMRVSLKNNAYEWPIASHQVHAITGNLIPCHTPEELL
jgi:hypothetical protein